MIILILILITTNTQLTFDNISDTIITNKINLFEHYYCYNFVIKKSSKRTDPTYILKQPWHFTSCNKRVKQV